MSGEGLAGTPTRASTSADILIQANGAGGSATERLTITVAPATIALLLLNDADRIVAPAARSI